MPQGEFLLKLGLGPRAAAAPRPCAGPEQQQPRLHLGVARRSRSSADGACSSEVFAARRSAHPSAATAFRAINDCTLSFPRTRDVTPGQSQACSFAARSMPRRHPSRLLQSARAGVRRHLRLAQLRRALAISPTSVAENRASCRKALGVCRDFSLRPPSAHALSGGAQCEGGDLSETPWPGRKARRGRCLGHADFRGPAIGVLAARLCPGSRPAMPRAASSAWRTPGGAALVGGIVEAVVAATEQSRRKTEPAASRR